jgi:hypothetical protein
VFNTLEVARTSSAQLFDAVPSDSSAARDLPQVNMLTSPCPTNGQTTMRTAHHNSLFRRIATIPEMTSDRIAVQRREADAAKAMPRRGWLRPKPISGQLMQHGCRRKCGSAGSTRAESARSPARRRPVDPHRAGRGHVNCIAAGNGSNHPRPIALLDCARHDLVDPGQHVAVAALAVADPTNL